MIMDRGDWVASYEQIGKVLMIHDDGSLNIAIYSRDGNRLGRTSPLMGGPKSFEPCCGPDGWEKINKPSFPLKKLAYLCDIVEYI